MSGTGDQVARDLALTDEIALGTYPDIVAVLAPPEPEPGQFFRVYLFRHPDLVNDLQAEHRVLAVYDAGAREVNLFEVEPGGEPCRVTPFGMSLAEVESAGGFVVTTPAAA